MANIICKQDKARGRQAAPSQITSDGRADRLGILLKKEPLKKGGLLGKEQNGENSDQI